MFVRAWGRCGAAGNLRSGMHRSKMTMVLLGLFGCMLLFGLAGGSSAADSAAGQAVPVPGSQQTASADGGHGVAGGQITEKDVAALVAEVEGMERDKQELDNRLSVETSRYESARLQMEESKKNIRAELDEVLQNSSSRSRLDAMFGRHDELLREEGQLSDALLVTQQELAERQLKLAQKRRDLERLQTRYASQQREEALRRVQKVAQQLERNLHFRETISFKCPASKSLGSCLSEYPLEARIQTWIEEHYQQVLSKELEDVVGPVSLSSDWYTTRVTRDFTEASMSLQGTVTADVDVRAHVRPRKMMACALLAASAELCEAQSISLIVRSNKYGDQVLVNKKPYGSTPLSLMLDPGVYNIEVRYQGLTQKRTLTLDENRHINFVF